MITVGGNQVVPHMNALLRLPGDRAIIGITRPYLKPWEIEPIRAANEPAKPPVVIEEAAPARDTISELRSCTRYFPSIDLGDNHGLE